MDGHVFLGFLFFRHVGFFTNGFLTFRVIYFHHDSDAAAAALRRAIAGPATPVIACDDSAPDAGLIPASLAGAAPQALPRRPQAPASAPTSSPQVASTEVTPPAAQVLRIYQPAFDPALPVFSFIQPAALPALLALSSPASSLQPLTARDTTASPAPASACDSPARSAPTPASMQSPTPAPEPIELPPKLRHVTWPLLERIKRALFGAYGNGGTASASLESFAEEAAEADYYRDFDLAQRDYAIRCAMARFRQVPSPPVPPFLGGESGAADMNEHSCECALPSSGSPTSPFGPPPGLALRRPAPRCPVPHFSLSSVQRVLALARRHFGKPSDQQPLVTLEAMLPPPPGAHAKGRKGRGGKARSPPAKAPRVGGPLTFWDEEEQMG